MGRWQPDGRGRLGAAAMELFAERGYERTTVAEIAARAGLTERTFFRHFTDKREVLFSGSELVARALVDTLAARTEDDPLAAVEAGFRAVAEVIGDDHDHSRTRMHLIEANPELLERELVKMATLARSTADALRERGVPEPEASLTAEAGVAAFRVAFEQWVTTGDEVSLADTVSACFAGLRRLS